MCDKGILGIIYTAYSVCAPCGWWLGIIMGSCEGVRSATALNSSDDGATKPDAEFEFCIYLEKKQVAVKGLCEELKEKSCLQTRTRKSSSLPFWKAKSCPVLIAVNYSRVVCNSCVLRASVRWAL